jgi:hypothetical protein
LKYIIKHGENLRTFKCQRCGCKFKATDDEITRLHSNRQAEWIDKPVKKVTWQWISFSTACPECDATCTIYLEGEDVLNDYNSRTRKSKHPT